MLVNFERVYALTGHVAPADLIYESEDMEADRFLLKKEIGFYGLGQIKATSDSHGRGAPYKKAHLLQVMLDEGELVEVEVDGWRGVYYAQADDIGLLQDLAAGRVPEEWVPMNTTTTDEAVFLAPLDPVSARGRAKVVFGFDYVWEVYKPAEKRTYGDIVVAGRRRRGGRAGAVQSDGKSYGGER